MPTSTAENYLKTLYQQQQRQESPEKPLAMGRLAQAMNVAPGTATAMIKTLASTGLVNYKSRGGVSLTEEGRVQALHILRRHRLVELLLVEVLGMNWAEVHEEAEVLEHAVSDKVLEKIDAYLGHPQADPHGDPIPTAKGKLKFAKQQNLIDISQTTGLKIARILDQNRAFLQFIHDAGLLPNTKITILKRDSVVDAITVQPVGGDPITLGTKAAAKILVQTDTA